MVIGDKDNKVGFVMKGGIPPSAFDMHGVFWMSWVRKADELNRVAHLALGAFHEDINVMKAEIAEMERRHQDYLKNPDRIDLLFGDGVKDRPPQTLFVAFFLASMAIENLLKGLLLVEFPEMVKDGKFRGEYINSHKLLNIAAKAGITLSDDEQTLCEMGEVCIDSFGRYSTGRNANDHPSSFQVNGTAFDVCDAFFSRLRTQIHERPIKQD